VRFAGLGGVMVWRYKVNSANQARATATVIEPYFAAITDDKLDDAWRNFTDDAYKGEYKLDDYKALHAKTFTESGKFLGYEIRTWEDSGGVFSDKAAGRVLVALKFERGGSKLVQYGIEQGSDGQFRIHSSGTYYNGRTTSFAF
jgi:hypothetical protein